MYVLCVYIYIYMSNPRFPRDVDLGDQGRDALAVLPLDQGRLSSPSTESFSLSLISYNII